MTGFRLMVECSPSSRRSRFSETEADVFDAGDAGAGGERFGAEVHIHHGTWPGPLWPEQQRQDLQ